MAPDAAYDDEDLIRRFYEYRRRRVGGRAERWDAAGAAAQRHNGLSRPNTAEESRRHHHPRDEYRGSRRPDERSNESRYLRDDDDLRRPRREADDLHRFRREDDDFRRPRRDERSSGRPREGRWRDEDNAFPSHQKSRNEEDDIQSRRRDDERSRSPFDNSRSDKERSRVENGNGLEEGEADARVALSTRERWRRPSYDMSCERSVNTRWDRERSPPPNIRKDEATVAQRHEDSEPRLREEKDELKACKEREDWREPANRRRDWADDSRYAYEDGRRDVNDRLYTDSHRRDEQGSFGPRQNDRLSRQYECESWDDRRRPTKSDRPNNSPRRWSRDDYERAGKGNRRLGRRDSEEEGAYREISPRRSFARHDSGDDTNEAVGEGGRRRDNRQNAVGRRDEKSRWRQAPQADGVIEGTNKRNESNNEQEGRSEPPKAHPRSNGPENREDNEDRQYRSAREHSPPGRYQGCGEYRRGDMSDERGREGPPRDDRERHDSERDRERERPRDERERPLRGERADQRSDIRQRPMPNEREAPRRYEGEAYGDVDRHERRRRRSSGYDGREVKEDEPKRERSDELERLEMQRRREIIREARIEKARKKRPRVERDIGERIALGDAAADAELHDPRLYGRDDGGRGIEEVVDAEDEEHAIYDKPLFALGRAAGGLGAYKYDPERIKQNVPDYEPH